MTRYEEILETLGRDYAPLWRLVYPRSYNDVSAWHSPKVPAVALASGVQAARAIGDVSRLPISMLTHYLVACALAEHAMPTYFVARTLLEAVARTDPPPDLRWQDLPMPHPGLLWMLPRGAVQHPTDGDICYLALARTEPGKPHQHPAIGSPSVAIRQGNLLLSAGGSAGSLPMWDVTLNPSQSPTLAGLAEITPGVDIRVDATGRHLNPVPLTASDNTFASALMGLAVRLWLVMLSRPQLVSAGRKTGQQKKASAIEFWSPTIIGSSFRATIEPQEAPDTEPAGGTKRLHWRRGHMRQQHHGEGWRDTKLIWIEPMLVGGKKP